MYAKFVFVLFLLLFKWKKKHNKPTDRRFIIKLINSTKYGECDLFFFKYNNSDCWMLLTNMAIVTYQIHLIIHTVRVAVTMTGGPMPTQFDIVLVPPVILNIMKIIQYYSITEIQIKIYWSLIRLWRTSFYGKILMRNDVDIFLKLVKKQIRHWPQSYNWCDSYTFTS